jgi:hypothetical protein
VFDDENTGSENPTSTGFQTGDYFGEDDIESVENDLGRIKYSDNNLPIC